MFKSFINWWNRDKIAERERIDMMFAQMQANIAELSAKKDAAEQELAVSKQQLEEASSELEMRRFQDAADEARRNGKDPWVEIKSAEFNDVKGIQIELDWNEAFVKYLRENGVTARDDDSVVQKWLLMLYQDLINRLEERVIENSDSTFFNEFE